jgi:2-dehydro-3-deoxyphosphooctonate aldolase (KDO 8-P synthase)
MKSVTVDGIHFSNKSHFVLIAGPCVLESFEHAYKMLQSLKDIAQIYEVPFVFKTSFDKANRTSIHGARGVGLNEAIPIFKELKKIFNVPILTDIHDSSDAEKIKDVIDIIQIPAFLCRQTDLLKAASETGKVINIKKGQFLAPGDMKNILSKCEYFGAKGVLLCERGVSFGYNQLVVDMRSLAILAQTLSPVVFDATHSVQEPGGEGTSTGGKRVFAPILARAALAVGIASIFAEVHDDPDSAPSDGPNMIKLNEFEEILKEWVAIDRVAKLYPRFL